MQQRAVFGSRRRSRDGDRLGTSFRFITASVTRHGSAFAARARHVVDNARPQQSAPVPVHD
jgi:hypothetical protein